MFGFSPISTLPISALPVAVVTPEPPVDTIIGGGGAGGGGARPGAGRLFPFLNRYDDPEIFTPKPEPVEAHPIQSEGDPVTVQRSLEGRPGPSSLADIGRQDVLPLARPALPKGPDRAAITAKAVARAKAAAERRAARLAAEEAQRERERKAREKAEREREDDEELAVLRFLEYI